jgi:hypothetical protein
LPGLPQLALWHFKAINQLDKAMVYDRTSTTAVIVQSIKNINGIPYLAPSTRIHLVNGLN